MRYLSAVLILLFAAVIAYADGDGTGILPFASPNCSGTITINKDGSVVVKGTVKGVPFIGFGKASVNADGKTVIDCPVDPEVKGRQQPWDRPFHAELSLDPDDYDDPGVDVPVGTVDVEGGPLGKGSIQVYG